MATSRVKVAEFGIIQKSLANAVVTIYQMNGDGSNSGVKATLYQESTGTAARENPQTLDEEGKLSDDCWIETDVVASITGITDKVDRSIKKIKQNPTEFSLSVTTANFNAVNVTDGIDDAEAAAAAAAADAAQTAADRVQTGLDVTTTNANVVSCQAAQTAAETAETNAETAETGALAAQAAAEAAVGAVKVSSNDTTAGDLEAKLLVGDGLALSTQNDGGNETRTVDIDIDSLSAPASPDGTETVMVKDPNDSNALKEMTTKQIADLAVSGLVLLGSYTASNATSVDIGDGLDLDAVIDGTYDHYIIDVTSVIAVTDGADAFLQISTDGGTSFVTTGYTSKAFGSDSSGTLSNSSSTGLLLTHATVGKGISNVSSEPFNCLAHLKDPSNSALKHSLRGDVDYVSEAGNSVVSFSSALDGTARDIDAVRFVLNNGNIATGTFYLYGVRKS